MSPTTQLGLPERFHRRLKEEEVYWRLHNSPAHARKCLKELRLPYITLRPHWALVPEAGGDPVTAQEVYQGTLKPQLRLWQGWAKAARAKLDRLLQPAA